MIYKNGDAWSVNLTDAEGNAIANSVVKIGIKIGNVDKVYSRVTDENGIASLPINLAPGTYAINATFEGNNKFGAAFVNATVTVAKGTLTISAEDLTMGYKDSSSYNVNVVDANGDAVSGIVVKVTLGNSNYNIKTDANGVAKLPINLIMGNYTVTATVNDAFYESNVVENAIAVTADNLAIVTEEVNMTYKDGTAFEVQLVDGNNNPVALANQVIKITIKTTTYSKKTDANGLVKLPINLAAGNYVFKTEYNGIELFNNVTVNKA